MAEPTRLHGMMAVFETPEALLGAAQRAREAGYQRMDAYTPYPVDGLPETLGIPPDRLPLIVLLSGLAGGILGYGMQFFAMAIHLPINVGGRPLNSWPAFVPITFELTILFGAFGAVIGMLAMNRLPQPYHPSFNVPGFEQVTLDRFALCIEAGDPLFERERTRSFLQGLAPSEVSDVEG
ncbi:hypothetical protein D3C72_231320 [compost metagenome]